MKTESLSLILKWDTDLKIGKLHIGKVNASRILQQSKLKVWASIAVAIRSRDRRIFQEGYTKYDNSKSQQKIVRDRSGEENLRHREYQRQSPVNDTFHGFSRNRMIKKDGTETVKGEG